jgi:hypothetical protein
MLDLSQIDLLLAIGVVVAIIAIGGGIRGVYSVSASARQDRTNQATTTSPVQPPSKKHKDRMGSTDRRRKAA